MAWIVLFGMRESDSVLDKGGCQPNLQYDTKRVGNPLLLPKKQLSLKQTANGASREKQTF